VLLAGQTLRGVADADLAALDLPVGVLPSVPEDPFHQRRTVDGCHRIEVAVRAAGGCATIRGAVGMQSSAQPVRR
jgi:hypothetical protein